MSNSFKDALAGMPAICTGTLWRRWLQTDRREECELVSPPFERIVAGREVQLTGDRERHLTQDSCYCRNDLDDASYPIQSLLLLLQRLALRNGRCLFIRSRVQLQLCKPLDSPPISIC